MEVEIKEALEEEEKEECFKIRKMVFVEKMSLFSESDIDEHDFKDKTLHLLAKFKGVSVGTVRIIDEGNGAFRGSRLAVLPKAPPFTGFKLVRYAVKTVESLGGKIFRAFLLPELEGFFRRCGWVWKGEKIIHIGKPHLIMFAKLKCSLKTS